MSAVLFGFSSTAEAKREGDELDEDLSLREENYLAVRESPGPQTDHGAL